MYEVQQTRWDRLIRRVSGSIGPGSRVSETLSELFPTIDLENVPAELLLLGGTQVCMGETVEGAPAAQFSQSMIRNPGDSNALICVTQARFSSNIAQEIVIGLTLNTFANAGTKTIRDGRRGPSGQPVGQVLSESLLVQGPTFFRVRVPVNGDIILTDPNELAVLSPGTAYAISTTVANTTLRCSYLWRERPAEESELSLE